MSCKSIHGKSIHGKSMPEKPDIDRHHIGKHACGMQRIEMHKAVSEELYCDDMQRYVSYPCSETLMGAYFTSIRTILMRTSLCGYLETPYPSRESAAVSRAL